MYFIQETVDFILKSMEFILNFILKAMDFIHQTMKDAYQSANTASIAEVKEMQATIDAAVAAKQAAVANVRFTFK